jgi:hypothetical protein
MGGGGSKCTKQDRIDPKPDVASNLGVTIAGSKQCSGCSLTLNQTSTTSIINVTRTDKVLFLMPTVPLSVTFNGTTAVFNLLLLYIPSPISVEHTQSDAVIHCISDSIWMYIPLEKSNSGPAVDFLSTIAGVLDPASAEGLGFKDPKTGSYKQVSVATGLDWSITNLIKGTDPYFTWVNGQLEQYVKSETECDRYIGWRTTSGPQVIFFQNPVGVSSDDLERIRQTIGVLDPSEIKLSLSNVLYSPGEAKCSPKLPKLKLPTFKPDSKLTQFAVYFGILLIAFLAVVLAVSLAMQTNGPIQVIGRSLSSMFTWDSKPPRPAPSVLPALPAGLPNLSALGRK